MHGYISEAAEARRSEESGSSEGDEEETSSRSVVDDLLCLWPEIVLFGLILLFVVVWLCAFRGVYFHTLNFMYGVVFGWGP